MVYGWDVFGGIEGRVFTAVLRHFVASERGIRKVEVTLVLWSAATLGGGGGGGCRVLIVLLAANF